MTKVDVTEVDGDLFAIARLWSKLAHVVRQCSFVHLYTICADGIWALTNLVASPRCQLLPRAGRGRQQGFHTGLHRRATASGQRNHRAGIMNYSPAGSPATGDGHLHRHRHSRRKAAILPGKSRKESTPAGKLAFSYSLFLFATRGGQRDLRAF